MTQASNGSLIATIIVCSVILLGAVWWGFSSIPEVPEIVIPTAAEIAALVQVPEAPAAPEIDTEKIDRVCELTDGCEYWESAMPFFWRNAVLDEEDDIEDELLDLLNLDDDDLEDIGGNVNDIFDLEVKDYQVRDYSTDYEGAEGNWEVKIFARVTYRDVDESDDDHAYVVITSVFDEGEYDELSIEEVTRRFEFD